MSSSARVGLLGGGQLGRMLIQAANRRLIQVNVLDKPGCSAKQIAAHDGHVDGSFKDPSAVKELAASCDILTVETEHVDTQSLEDLASQIRIEPSWKTLRTIQNKFVQKEHLIKYGVDVVDSMDLEGKGADGLGEAGLTFGYPFLLKSKTEAYDGRGNILVKKESEIDAAMEAMGGRPLYAERLVDFKLELAVMVVKTKDNMLTFPTTETVHENSICRYTYTPPRDVSKPIQQKAQELAKKAAGAFEGKGVIGVEMFLLKDDTLLVNEIAPRPHNSGHYTIEACPMSQFEAHLCAILDHPIHAKSLRLREPAIMLNILGGQDPESHLRVADEARLCPNATIHLYGKGDATPGRKMGHITITAPTMHEAEAEAQHLIDFIGTKRGVERPISPKVPPRIAVIMGSKSDLSVMNPCFDLLKEFKLDYEPRITSAHRTPDVLRDFAMTAADKGLKVIIAGAGGAAHLPGMCAAWTQLPVIGVPIKAGHFQGMDALLSMTEMPLGEPVATVGVNKAGNAVLLAIRMLASSDDELASRLKAWMAFREEQVKETDTALQAEHFTPQ